MERGDVAPFRGWLLTDSALERLFRLARINKLDDLGPRRSLTSDDPTPDAGVSGDEGP